MFKNFFSNQNFGLLLRLEVGYGRVGVRFSATKVYGQVKELGNALCQWCITTKKEK